MSIKSSLKKIVEALGGTSSAKNIPGVIDEIATNASGGSGSGNVVVTATIGDLIDLQVDRIIASNYVTLDKSFNEISAEIEAGNEVAMKTSNFPYDVTMRLAASVQNSVFLFSSVLMEDELVAVASVVVMNDNNALFTIANLGGSGSGSTGSFVNVPCKFRVSDDTYTYIYDDGEEYILDSDKLTSLFNGERKNLVVSCNFRDKNGNVLDNGIRIPISHYHSGGDINSSIFKGSVIAESSETSYSMFSIVIDFTKKDQDDFVTLVKRTVSI